MGTRFSLLMVSDSEDLARTLAGLLTASGYDPAYTLVDNPVELSAALAEEPWDIVAASADCPGLPWEDILALARAARETIPMLLIVPDPAPELAREAIAAGVDDVLEPGDWRTAAVFARILREGVHRKELSRLWERLRGEERKYRGMIDNSVLGIFQCRPWGEIISANPSFARIFGYLSTQELLRDYARANTRLNISSDDLDKMLGMIGDTGLVSGFETEAFRRDGSRFWASVSARPILGESGEVAAIEGTVEDVSDRKAMESLIIRAKQEWEQTFDNVPDVIAILDQKQRIRRANRALAGRLGVHPRDIIGRQCHEVLSLASLPDTQVQPEEAGQPAELAIPALNGTFLVSFTPFVLEHDEQQSAGTVMVAHEISRRKQLEGQLRQSHKMEAIGTLAGGIAHDFNNILGVMMGYTEMSLDEVERGTRLHRRLGEVLSAGRRARDLIHQILTFSRQEELNLQPLQFATVLKETVKLMRASLPANIKIHLAADDAEATIHANISQIQQVVMNLCTNAAHAMRESGGTMQISLNRIQLDNPRSLGLSQLSPGEYLRLSVADTGYGIPPEILENIFDPFFTTKKPDEGTGMGLALVHGIVTAHGGTVSVRSTPGEGSCFDVLFPFAPAGTQEEPAATPPPLSARGRALIVDDEASLAEVIGEMVEKVGYQAEVFSDSGMALQQFLTAPDRYHLLITDQTMPGLTGGELARAVLKHRPDLPVIVCTGFSDQLSPEQAKALGVRQYLLKPVLRDDLNAALNAIAASGTSLES